jgi:macrolide-specific efflux system membrane fusion protein
VDGQQEERQITLGLSDGTNTEVLSGLEEGEKVVVPAPTSTQQSSSFFGM